ncbi:MAG: proline--tRNA ligase [Oscillospiraceae bacterium]|nr:proline--tRNA ligase [Oscillospiraceae bacterium]
MRLSKMVGERFKEQPTEAVLVSHSLMIRGGYIRQVTQGVYSLLPPARRITRKIEQILREEMDRIDGQEVLFPVTMPRELWDESGRYTSVGQELLRFKDRNGHDMLLGMTHEEASVHMCRNDIKSHARMPFMIYQIQTKFRDEPRSRGGLIRVREFTMKDGYSFHVSQEDLQAYYDRCHEAYFRIFRRAGIPGVVSVKSDTGMMGGSMAHEFMLLCDAGEDTIVLCDKCGYSANMEVAEAVLPDGFEPCGEQNSDDDAGAAADTAATLTSDVTSTSVVTSTATPSTAKAALEAAGEAAVAPTTAKTAVEAAVAPSTTPATAIEEIHTPGVVTIEDLSSFLQIQQKYIIKAVAYQVADRDNPLIVFLRGDLDANEAKLKRHLMAEITPASEEFLKSAGACVGFMGPLGLDRSKLDVLFDVSLKGGAGMVCGANKGDYHLKGCDVNRDFHDMPYGDIAKVKEGSLCKHCGATIRVSRGIEVGNIFQLGDKYSKAMNMRYTDSNGESLHPIMGCYGIGVGRLMASALEVCHDDNGPIWPVAIAPWHVHICALRYDDEDVRSTSEELYATLCDAGVETVYDDRNESAGVQFADADLLGVPVRIIISPRNLKDGKIEIVSRDKSLKEVVPLDLMIETVKDLLNQLSQR